MNILHLEASPGWGGQEIRILRESIGMRERGHQIILGIAKNGKFVAPARKEGFIVHEIYFQKKFWIFSFFYLLYLMKKYHIDLVNTHSPFDAWLGGFCAKLLKIPVIRTRHLSTSVKGGLNGFFLYNKLADFVVTTCQSVIPHLSQKSRKETKFFKSIPTGIDPKTLFVEEGKKELFRKNFKILPKDFLVGMACFMRSWKGVEEFLKAAEILKKEKNLKWILIGGGTVEKYRKQAGDLVKENIVFFTGHLENPFEAIASLDAFVLLSTGHEGVSQASLQAAYLKKPLIMTPTGGLSEVCIDGVTGIQVPIFSPEKVAEAVLRLKNDPALCLRMGKEGKKLVEKNFTFEKMLQEMEEVYANVQRRT